MPDNARALLDAVVAITSDLDLDTVLDRIVGAACEITGARSGHLEIAGGSLHRPLEGVQEPAVKGALLRVPMRIRGSLFGHLYVSDKSGGDFTDLDKALVGALATAAGSVIENARTLARSEHRRQWLEVSARVTDALQPPVRTEEALRQVTIALRRISRAAAVALVRRNDDEFEVLACDGARVQELPTIIARLATDIRDMEQQTDVVILPQPQPQPQPGVSSAVRTVVLVRLRAHLDAGGVLLLALDDDRTCLDPDLTELLGSFADQASLALDRAQALSDRQELMLITDRDRIARDLHDLVIQRLFATGLQLQGARRIAESDEVRGRLDNAVAELDVTIRDIRSTIFELQHSHELSLRADVRGVVKEYVPVLGFTPVVRTSGPVDTAVPQPVAAQLLAVLREALSNVARHAGATSTTIDVEVIGGDVLVRVSDDGRGVPEERHESGLRNVRRRATEHGGAVRLLPEEPHGTSLEWRVPLPRAG